MSTIKEIKLFLLLYDEFNEGKEIETEKFDNAKQLLEDCNVIFTDIYKGNQEILDKFQKLFKKEKYNQVIEEELKKLKDYYEINEKESGDVAKIFLCLLKEIFIKLIWNVFNIF